MRKFGRIYECYIEVSKRANELSAGTFIDNAVIVKSPLTLNFSITRNMLAKANTAHFLFYNLAASTRKLIFHDRYSTWEYRQIILKAGYQDDEKLPIIFQGNLVSAYSYRQGTEWITEIEAFDGGYGIINSYVNTTLPAGHSAKDIIQTLFSSMKNILPGAIGSFTTDNSRGVTLSGNSWDTLNAFTAPGNCFIDSERVHALQKDEYVRYTDSISEISIETGLLGTPRIHDAVIDTELLFEPRIVVGQSLYIQSLQSEVNGLYVVIGFSHVGTISGAVGGNCTTTINMFKGTTGLKGISQ